MGYRLKIAMRMLPRLVLGSNGLIQYATTLDPPFLITLAKYGGAPCDSAVHYRFDLSGRSVASKPGPKPCQFVLSAPQRTYSLTVSGGSDRGTKRIVVRSFVIVGLGDSVASGEGNPDIPSTGPLAPIRWEDPRCDQSAYSFEAQSAEKIEQLALPKASVTFFHLACSGAGITSGVTGTYWGIAPGGALLPVNSQISDMKSFLGATKPDAVLISIGANDISFGAIVADCAANPNCPNETIGGQTLAQITSQKLSDLPSHYAKLAAALAAAGVPHDRVYITQYFDPTRDDSGQFCTFPHFLGLMGTVDAQWAYSGVVAPLNQQVAAAAQRYHWNLVTGAQQGFQDHGYCAANSWVVSLAQSVAGQGDDNGTMHPNRLGHAFIAGLVVKLLQPDLLPGGRPRPLN